MLNVPGRLSLAQYIDHTLLRPDAKESEILKICDEAVEHGFRTVCIEKQWLKAARARLGGSQVLPITVISFPEGIKPPGLKAGEAKEGADLGAREIDMVLNRVYLKEKRYGDVLHDIRSVVEAVAGIPVKVILETSELTRDEKVIACSIAKAAGAAFVKTSTGFSKSGATAEDVALMRATVGDDLGVKASGGVRTFEDAWKMIQAGATRLGTSASVAIVQGVPAGEGSY